MEGSSRYHGPWATLLLVFFNSFVFLLEKRALNVGVLQFLFDDYAFSPSKFFADPLTEFPTLITHLFLHANDAHLIGNMLFFLLFAFSVERVVGSVAFLLSYCVWGAVAGFMHVFFSPFTAGLIGASGAISGTAGAFFVLYPLKTPLGGLVERLKGRHFNFLVQALKGVTYVPAFVFIGLWFLLQIQAGFLSLVPSPVSGQFETVAYWAHIGGFAAGALTILPVRWVRQSAPKRRA